MNRFVTTFAASVLFAATWVSTANAQRTPDPAPEPGKNQEIAKPDTHGKGLEVRIVTSNVEFWAHVFLPHHTLATTQPGLPDNVVEVLKNAEESADEENWEVSRNVMDLKPDVWCVQECCEQKDLEYFNHKFLADYFETVHVFKTNTERDQNVALLCRPGFKVLDWKEDYYKEIDPNHTSPLSDKLFARGPGFALIQAPNGTKFWVGTNHAKSKYGNSVQVTKWRNAEATRTHDIIEELRKAGPAQVFFLGDMNDELGMQEFEQEAGGSAIEAIAGTGPDALTIVTKPLADAGQISYHGMRTKRHQSFIDHIFATPEANQWITNCQVFTTDLAQVASDHYPVYIDVTVP